MKSEKITDISQIFGHTLTPEKAQILLLAGNVGDFNTLIYYFLRRREDSHEIILDVSGINISRSYLNGIILAFTRLDRVILDGSLLMGADLTGASLEGASLKNTSCQSAIFKDAILRKADLTGADLRGTSFDGADLEKANFCETNVTIEQLLSAKNAHLALLSEELQNGLKEASFRQINRTIDRERERLRSFQNKVEHHNQRIQELILERQRLHNRRIQQLIHERQKLLVSS